MTDRWSEGALTCALLCMHMYLLGTEVPAIVCGDHALLCVLKIRHAKKSLVCICACALSDQGITNFGSFD